MSKRKTAAAKAERAQAAIERRAQVRLAREREAGTVFFAEPIETGFTELKLRAGELTFLREQSGEYSGVRRYRLRRLERASWQPGRLRIRGEFYYSSGEKLAVPRGARIVRSTVSVVRPLQNEDILREFLASEQRRATATLPTPARKIFAERLKAALVPLAAVGFTLAMLPGLVAEAVTSRKVSGTLEGFCELGGKHYPRYSFSLPDGSVRTRTDTELALEDAVTPDEARRILRRRCPRKVTVRCSRRNPDKCRCVYL